MSCFACDEAQMPNPLNEMTGLTQATFVRVGRANILISGCQEHLKDMLEILDAGREAMKEEPEDDK